VLGDAGHVTRGELFRTFNMGVGLVALVAPDAADAVLAAASAASVPAWRLGHLTAGRGQVILT
jgi:phosphoribosylformylglycinamidine cyclo-ligase